jgi:hypothetical protein
MLNQRLKAANTVAGKLFAAEAAIDQAIIAIGALANALPQAQAEVKLSAVVGDAAYARLGAAVAAMFESRTNIVGLHNELESIKGAIGLANFQIIGTGDAAKIVRPQARNDAETVEAARAA